jgi:hypothetical protein
MTLTTEQIEQIKDISRTLEVSAELDWEANIGGNGISAFEGVRVSRVIMKILNIDIEEISEEELEKIEEQGCI